LILFVRFLFFLFGSPLANKSTPSCDVRLHPLTGT